VSITEHVQAEVDKEDNRQKLREAPASARRHLFVGLDHSDWYVSSQFLDEDFTPPPPQLPNEVDYVWVGVEDPATGRLAVLLRRDSTGTVAIDPDTGQSMSVEPDQDGPPAVRTCPRCGSSCDWRPVQRTRRDFAGWPAATGVDLVSHLLERSESLREPRPDDDCAGASATEPGPPPTA